MTASTRHPTVILPVPTYSRSSAPRRRGNFAPKGKKIPNTAAEAAVAIGMDPRDHMVYGRGREQTTTTTPFASSSSSRHALFSSGLVFNSPPPFVHRTQLQIPPRRFVGGRRLRPLHVRGTRIHLVPPSLRNLRRLEETLTPADPPNPRLNLCHKPRQYFSSEAPPK